MNQDHIFLDTETSNRDPKTGCIIEIAAIRTDAKGKVLSSFTQRITPDREVEAEAARVNGYTANWGGIPFQEAMYAFNHAMVREDDKVVFVAHFADFDRQFIRSDCQRMGVEVPLDTRAWICTGNLVWPYVYQDQLKSRKLSDVCKFLGIEYIYAHDAAADCKAVMDVYFELMRRFSTMLVAHTAISQSQGGPILSGLERLVQKFT
jgi:DNA polymerase III epsilon subunit-like protein